MKRRNADRPGANRSERRRLGTKSNGKRILPDSLASVNFITSESHEQATGGQKSYLHALRRRVGLDVWNETKARLDIDTPGVEGLTKYQAGRLITALVGGSSK
jgi:hypothetical protein